VIPDPANLSTLTEMALNTMLPRVKAELSLLNSLWEIKDLKSLPFKLGKFATSLERLKNASFWDRPIDKWFPKGLRKKNLLVELRKLPDSLRSATHNLSGSYLELMFNIRPIISDVTGIHQALLSIASLFNKLVHQQGQMRTRHFAFSYHEGTAGGLDAVVTDWPGSEPVDGGQISCHTIRNVSRISANFHAEIQYQFWYSDFQTQHAALLSLLDSLGVNFNLGTIWRGIPFSFVVDWVVGVGRWLDRFKTRNMDPQINIRRYLWSIKRQRTTTCLSGFSSSVYPPSPSLFVPQVSYRPTVTETSYKRVVKMPSRLSFETSGLSSVEFSLAAALLLSRRPRRKTARQRLS
jgi:hypothetical protein